MPAGVKHVALVTCPYPAARIVSIDKSAALAIPGVHYVLDGKELAAGTAVLSAGLDTPNVPRRPLAVDVARYAGEWVVAVVADTRAIAEDAAEAVQIEYEQLPFVWMRSRPTPAARWSIRPTARTCCSTAPSSGAT